jgi:hypothetical protein
MTPTPVVYLGPDASEALEEGRGVLLGAQRPGWVDAVHFRAAPAGPWKELIERRFRPHRTLEPVGIVLAASELRRLGQALARELVPGDVVLAVPARRGKPVAYVNRGDRLAPARLKISRIL